MIFVNTFNMFFLGIFSNVSYEIIENIEKKNVENIIAWIKAHCIYEELSKTIFFYLFKIEFTKSILLFKEH